MLIVGTWSTTATGLFVNFGVKSKCVFKPEHGRLVGSGQVHCELVKGNKTMKRPGAKEDKEGYAECSQQDSPNTTTIIVNENSLQFSTYTLMR